MVAAACLWCRPRRAPAPAIVGQFAVPSSAGPVAHGVPDRAWPGGRRAGDLRDVTDACGIDHRCRTWASVVVPFVPARDGRPSRSSRQHTAADRWTGYHARSRVGAADRRGRRTLIRRAARHRHRSGSHSARRSRYPGRQHGPDARAGDLGATAAAVGPGVAGRLHDRRTRRVDLLGRRDHYPAGAAVCHRHDRAQQARSPPSSSRRVSAGSRCR